MSKRKDTVEKWFEASGAWLYDNPLKVLLVSCLLASFFALHIPSISIDTSSEALLKKGDPSLQVYNQFRDQFGRAELIVIGVQSPEIFSRKFLDSLRSFHQDLEAQIPYLREVTSLINVRRTHGDQNDLIVEELLERWPQDRTDLVRLQTTVMSNPFYLNYLVSEDAGMTAVIIETEAAVGGSLGTDADILEGFDQPDVEHQQGVESPRYFSEKENREVVSAINRVVKQHAGPDFQIVVSGGPVVVNAFNLATMQDIRRCIWLSLVSVALFLGILFRRWSGVVLPMIIIIAALASTMGIMSLTGVPIKITTTVIPAFLLSVGVCDSVHILAIFLQVVGQWQR